MKTSVLIEDELPGLRAADFLYAPAGAAGLVDLQRFAAEDEGRTEDPTERRKREEREKGNVARSQDLPGAVILLGTVIVVFFLGSYMVQAIASLFYTYFDRIGSIGGQFSIEETRIIMSDLFTRTGMIVLPVLATALVMGVLGNVVQVGLMFSMRTLEFKPERLIPDFKRVLPVRRNIVNLGKIIIQVSVVAAVAYLVVVDDFIPMLKASGMGLRQAVGVFGLVAFKLLVVCAIVLLVIAIPDYFYQRFEYIENLKMTSSEAKRERKDEEGDPLVRQRQREKTYEMRNQRNMLQEVPTADVVVTNPTHFSVALKYDQVSHTAPVVIAKGSDQIALMIRRIAKEHSVPIEENPPLARALYREVEVGQELPENFYRAVSIIFSRLSKFRSAV